MKIHPPFVPRRNTDIGTPSNIAAALLKKFDHQNHNKNPDRDAPAESADSLNLSNLIRLACERIVHECDDENGTWFRLSLSAFRSPKVRGQHLTPVLYVLI